MPDLTPEAADLIKATSPEVEPADADILDPIEPADLVGLVTDWEPTTDDEIGEDA